MSFMFTCSQKGSWSWVCRYFSGMGCVPTTTGRPCCFSMLARATALADKARYRWKEIAGVGSFQQGQRQLRRKVGRHGDEAGTAEGRRVGELQVAEAAQDGHLRR